MSIAIPDADLSVGSSCGYVTPEKGRREIISNCEADPTLFWSVDSLGTIHIGADDTFDIVSAADLDLSGENVNVTAGQNIHLDAPVFFHNQDVAPSIVTDTVVMYALNGHLYCKNAGGTYELTHSSLLIS